MLGFRDCTSINYPRVNSLLKISLYPQTTTRTKNFWRIWRTNNFWAGSKTSRAKTQSWPNKFGSWSTEKLGWKTVWTLSRAKSKLSKGRHWAKLRNLLSKIWNMNPVFEVWMQNVNIWRYKNIKCLAQFSLSFDILSWFLCFTSHSYYHLREPSDNDYLCIPDGRVR